jgi:hypothetical protein
MTAWGQDLERPICQVARSVLNDLCSNAVSTIAVVAIWSDELVTALRTLKVDITFKGFNRLIERVRNDIIDERLISILRCATHSGFAAIKSLTGVDQEDFETGLIEIGNTLIVNETQRNLEIFSLLLRIWDSMKLKMNMDLLDKHLRAFEKNQPGSME